MPLALLRSHSVHDDERTAPQQISLGRNPEDCLAAHVRVEKNALQMK
jgi:hypothetical protein